MTGTTCTLKSAAHMICTKAQHYLVYCQLMAVQCVGVITSGGLLQLHPQHICLYLTHLSCGLLQLCCTRSNQQIADIELLIDGNKLQVSLLLSISMMCQANSLHQMPWSCPGCRQAAALPLSGPIVKHSIMQIEQSVHGAPAGLGEDLHCPSSKQSADQYE